MIHHITCAALACAVLAAAPAQAAPAKAAPPKAMQVGPTTLSFRMLGDEITVPTPAGYCEPTGPYADAAQVAAAGDSQNVTLLSLYNCAEMAAGAPSQHWAFIKAPKSLMSTRATLAQLLEGMGAVPESDLKAALEDPNINEGVQKELSKVTGADVKVASSIVPVDRDANGYYLAGTVQMSAGESNIAAAVAVGFTAVKGHLITYNLYGPGQSPAAVRAVLDVARVETKRIVDANR